MSQQNFFAESQATGYPDIEPKPGSGRLFPTIQAQQRSGILRRILGKIPTIANNRMSMSGLAYQQVTFLPNEIAERQPTFGYKSRSI